MPGEFQKVTTAGAGSDARHLVFVLLLLLLLLPLLLLLLLVLLLVLLVLLFFLFFFASCCYFFGVLVAVALVPFIVLSCVDLLAFCIILYHWQNRS